MSRWLFIPVFPQERTMARNWGIRAKKAKEAAEDAAVIGKK